MKFLITGDRGFVGEATKRIAIDHEIVGFDIMDGRDIRDEDVLYEVVEKERPDRILHLAAIARFSEADKDPYLAFKTNVEGTELVVRVANAFNIPLVYASTGSVYMPIKREPPITEDFPAMGNSVYGCTKYMGEEFVRRAKVPHIILRYAHLYGKEKRHHGLIGGFMDRINRGLAPTLYGGKQSNDFTYIKDVATANLLALTAPWDAWNQVYNIGTGEELTAEDAGDIICKMSGFDGTIERVQGREVDPQRFVYDMTKARNMLGFEPKYTFEQGLKEMFDGEGKDMASR